MPMSTSTPSRNRRYPWATWLDGRRRAIPEAQFDVTIESFRSTARTAARNRGLEVSVTGGLVEGQPVFIIEAIGVELDQGHEDAPGSPEHRGGTSTPAPSEPAPVPAPATP